MFMVKEIGGSFFTLGTQLSLVYNDHAPSHARLNSAENKQ